jgi:6-phosphofructokinase
MPRIRHIGILTGGGDCPGINAVIRAVVKTAVHVHGLRVTGFLDGFAGLMSGAARPLGFDDVSGILVQGGTILGTSNRDDPFRVPVDRGACARSSATRSDAALRRDAGRRPRPGAGRSAGVL